MSERVLYRAAVVGALAAAALAGGACTDRRASVLEPLVPNSYDFALSRDPRNVPSGSLTVKMAAGGTDSLILTVRSLEPLTTGVYQLWLGTTDNATASGFVKATGTITVIRTDTSLTPEGDIVTQDVTVSTTSGASSFTDGGPSTRIVLRASTASIGSSPLAHNLLLVSVEADANATEPSAVRPLWTTYSQTATSTRSLKFGTFDPRPDSAYVFVPAGRGLASVLGNVLMITDSSLARPPRGYYYAAWAILRDTANAITDTVFLGELTAPPPRRNVSLRNADESIVDPVVVAQPPLILAAANRVRADTLGLGAAQPFKNFANVYVTLENKRGNEATASPTIILSGEVPGIVRLGQVP